ncbi:hypothetical protein B0O99DRAFT_712970 [Bisporella sp. PMI_857]|nr:hypothetical protein B0O99DRAFT_712970 [Bisporella sp. PMI_857]
MTRSKEAQDTSGRTRLTEKASLARHIREARIERARQGREGRGRGRGRGGRYTLERSPQPGPRLNAQGEPRQSDRVAQGDTYIPAYATRGRSRYPSRPVFRHDQGQRSEYRERSPLSDHSRRRQYYERTESYRRGDRGGHTSLPLPSRQESFQLRAEPRRHGRSRSPFRIRQERYQQRSKFHHESRSQSPVQYIREDRYEQHQMSSQFNEPVRSRYRAQRHLISEYTGIGVQSQNAPYAHQNPYLHERITGINFDQAHRGEGYQGYGRSPTSPIPFQDSQYAPFPSSKDRPHREDTQPRNRRNTSATEAAPIYPDRATLIRNDEHQVVDSPAPPNRAASDLPFFPPLPYSEPQTANPPSTPSSSSNRPILYWFHDSGPDPIINNIPRPAIRDPDERAVAPSNPANAQVEAGGEVVLARRHEIAPERKPESTITGYRRLRR